MKLPLIIVLLFSSLVSFGQQPEYPDSGFTNKTEAKNKTRHGLKQGKWCEYEVGMGLGFDFRIIHDTEYYSLTIYKDDKPRGIVRMYYPSGVYMGMRHYTYDNRTFIEKDYYEDGRLQKEGPYIDGVENGIIKEYYE
jgi:antitoxin component YwqK of YwqJK toxin-antitoxin module